MVRAWEWSPHEWDQCLVTETSAPLPHSTMWEQWTADHRSASALTLDPWPAELGGRGPQSVVTEAWMRWQTGLPGVLGDSSPLILQKQNLILGEGRGMSLTEKTIQNKTKNGKKTSPKCKFLGTRAARSFLCHSSHKRITSRNRKSTRCVICKLLLILPNSNMDAYLILTSLKFWKLRGLLE